MAGLPQQLLHCSPLTMKYGWHHDVHTTCSAQMPLQVTLLRKSGAGADHPLHPAYPEGEYLTALTYRVN